MRAKNKTNTYFGGLRGEYPEEVTFQLRSEGYIGGSVGKSRIGGMHPYNLKNHT